MCNLAHSKVAVIPTGAHEERCYNAVIPTGACEERCYNAVIPTGAHEERVCGVEESAP